MKLVQKNIEMIKYNQDFVNDALTIEKNAKNILVSINNHSKMSQIQKQIDMEILNKKIDIVSNNTPTEIEIYIGGKEHVNKNLIKFGAVLQTKN